jgi:hypothetical protein
MGYWIEVSDPRSEQSVSWKAMSLKSAKNQAKIEANKGAKVRIIKGTTASSGDADVVWTNHGPSEA